MAQHTIIDDFEPPKSHMGSRVIMALLILGIVGGGCFGASQLIRNTKTIEQENISAAPAPTEAAPEESALFESVAVSNDQVHVGELILINGDNSVTLPAESIPGQELVLMYDEAAQKPYSLSGTELRLEKNALDAFERMIGDFAAATGHTDLLVTSAYRSTQEQQEMYDADLAETGAETSSIVSLPGHSEHESGLAVDLSIFTSDGVTEVFDGSGDYAWIRAHCGEYGYILRYPGDKIEKTGIEEELWHYRYVGVPHAEYMMQNQLCMEEYIDLMRSYPPESPLSFTDHTGELYEIYYIAADAGSNETFIQVPVGMAGTVNGNNVDGFIVTVDTGIKGTDAQTEETPAEGTVTEEAAPEAAEAAQTPAS